MIGFNNVTYTYPNGMGVFNVHLRILPGEFYFLIGPSGAGKTNPGTPSENELFTVVGESFSR